MHAGVKCVLTARSASARLQSFETTFISDPARSLDISRYNKNPLHHYDEDVVRELSIPPDSLSPSATTRSQLPQSNGFPTYKQLEGPPSSFLTSPLPHNVSIEHTNTRPWTPPTVHTAQPGLFTHHGLPASLPPHPRTTFYSHNNTNNTTVPEPDNLVSYIDSLLRGSYSHMLSTRSEAHVPSTSAPELAQGAELSLDDMLRADYLDQDIEEYLTSPLLQDDSPEETPFLETPMGEDPWTSPMVDEADDSFGFGDMPLFGAAMRQRKEEEPTENGKATTAEAQVPESMLDLLRIFSPPKPTPLSSFGSSKIDSVTPSMDPLDSSDMLYSFPPTPALAPASLYNSPCRPSPLPLPPLPAPSSSSAATTSSTPSAAAMSNQARPTKALPTGTRRNITPSALVPLDAPTQPRQYVTPSATSRKAIPAAFTKGKKRARSEVDGGGVHDGDDDQLGLDDRLLDPNTQEAIEAKRRQNTIAARRSRQRKLEHVRELEDAVEKITQDRDMWMGRAYDAEARLRANGLS